MAGIISKRVTAKIEGDFVVFLIGMRINKFWKPWKWLPVMVAMPRMLQELEGRPESGFLGRAAGLGDWAARVEAAAGRDGLEAGHHAGDGAETAVAVEAGQAGDECLRVRVLGGSEHR